MLLETPVQIPTQPIHGYGCRHRHWNLIKSWLESLKFDQNLTGIPSRLTGILYRASGSPWEVSLGFWLEKISIYNHVSVLNHGTSPSISAVSRRSDSVMITFRSTELNIETVWSSEGSIRASEARSVRFQWPDTGFGAKNPIIDRLKVKDLPREHSNFWVIRVGLSREDSSKKVPRCPNND